MLFVGDGLYEDIDEAKIPNIDVIFAIEDFSILYKKHKSLKEGITKAAIQWDTEFAKNLTPGSFKFDKIANDKLAAIVYTSGTTGFSKGVMLSHNSLIGNIVYAHEHMPLKAGERILSFLPLAHAYGCAFEFLFPFTTWLSYYISYEVAFTQDHPEGICRCETTSYSLGAAYH